MPGRMADTEMGIPIATSQLIILTTGAVAGRKPRSVTLATRETAVSLQSGIAQLQEALRRLAQTAEQVGLYWTDAKYQEFLTEHYQPLEMLVRRTLQEMERLEQALHQMQRDCT
ncbi:hypothetical protein HRbin36_02072 [bacterium HR36]|nr:hypothetical protein HRbin36_02072 [bacterium HR36]